MSAKVIPFPGQPNNFFDLSYEEGDIDLMIFWPAGPGTVMPLRFKAKDMELVKRAIRGEQWAYDMLAEMNGYPTNKDQGWIFPEKK